MVNHSLIANFKTLFGQAIENELSKNPPNYWNAFVLASRISEDKNLPPSVRYVYILKKVTYALSTQFFLIEGQSTEDALSALEERNYTHVQKLLKSKIKKVSTDSKNPKKIIYSSLMKELEEAQLIYNSPNFMYPEKGTTITFGFLFLLSPKQYPYFINVHEKSINLIYMIPPSPISLFP